MSNFKYRKGLSKKTLIFINFKKKDNGKNDVFKESGGIFWVVTSTWIICKLLYQLVYALILKNNGSDVCQKSIQNLHAKAHIKNIRIWTFHLLSLTTFSKGG